MTWESPFSTCTNDLKFPFPYTEPPPFPPLETCDLDPLPIRSPATPPAASPNTKGGKGKSHSQLSASSGSHFPWKNVAPYLSVFYGTGLGFLGKKMHLFVWGFLSDNPSIVVHLPVFFFPSLICLQWVLCHSKDGGCLVSRGKRSRTALGCSPADDPLAAQQSQCFLLECLAKSLLPSKIFAKEGCSLGGVHLRPSTGLNI